MTPQKPAEGIVLTKELPDSKFYRVPCSCGNPDDDIEFNVEVEDWGEITVHTHTRQKTSWWVDTFNQRKSYDYDKEWQYHLNYWLCGVLNALAHRVKVTWSVWTKGYVEYSQTTIMSKQQALNYAATLQQAIQDLEEYNCKH
jgi:hypothetical protein